MAELTPISIPVDQARAKELITEEVRQSSTRWSETGHHWIWLSPGVWTQRELIGNLNRKSEGSLEYFSADF